MYWIGCLIGFIFQSNEVCRVFFAYNTTSSVEMSVPNEIPIPSLSVCVRYDEVLNRTDPTKLSNPPTIKQIFDLTPSPTSIIDHCCVRTFDMLENRCRSLEECLGEILTLTKYYRQEYMCYMYYIKSPRTVSLLDVSHSAWWSKSVYTMRLKGFNGMETSIEVILDPHHNLPIYSRNFGKFSDTGNPVSQFRLNKFDVSFRYIDIHRLPPPFDTSCTHNESQGMDECRRSCLINEMKVIDRFPATEMTSKPVNLLHTGYDLGNETMRTILNSIKKDCISRCPHHSCRTLYATTGIQPKAWYGNGLDLGILATDVTIVKITFHATMTLLDFVIYIVSCLGLWFGLSVTSINPQKIRLPWIQRVFPRLETNQHEILFSIRQELRSMRNRQDEFQSEIKSSVDVLTRQFHELSSKYKVPPKLVKATTTQNIYD